MERRQLITCAGAAALFAPSIGHATLKDRDTRALTSRISFRHAGRTVRPTALLALEASGPVGWQLNREFNHYPIERSLLNKLGKGLLRDPLEIRIRGAKPAGNVYLYGNVLAVDAAATGAVPEMCSVAHGNTEWHIKKRPQPLRLRNLPSVGRLFRKRVGRTFATQKELIILLTPTILTQPAS